ncbi:MAG TPA: protein kinase [Bacteroidota bacterium]|nr:protein kinase [Bacteroidota bacterium]
MIGTTISHYKILEKLGEGGMGVVYKAEDLRLKRIVALKFLPQHLTSTEAERSRFLQEAQAAATLNHPNICTIHAIEEDNGQQFIDMEYIDGVTLRRKLPVEKFSEAITLALQVGEALQEAHGKGIVHRDIKADNIMVNTKNQAKVMDFGLAKLKGSLKLTKTSSTVGTLAYMAPEQIQGSEVDARSDIFSFGTLLFEMITGRMPFRGEHEAAVMYSILNEEPDSVVRYKPDISPDIDRIIRRALEKEPEDRYQSMADMVSELRRMQKQSTRVARSMSREFTPQVPDQEHRSRENVPIESKSAGGSPRRSRRFLVPGSAAALVVIAVIGYLLFISPHQTIDSIAVLPFTNMGSDSSTEYLSDGITESLINSLSQVSNLTVMSRSSVFHFKGKDVDPQAAGKTLGVKAVLTGRIIQRGTGLTISTELVNVANNSHIWGEQYNEKLSDILGIQDQISKEISEKLSLKLVGDDEKKLTRHATENTEAYQYYLKGRFFWNKRTAGGLREAISQFKLAIEKDPGYALAYGGLASAYALLPEYAGVPPAQAIQDVEAAATKASDLDPSLAEPHAVLGLIKFNFDWDWAGAEEEFQKAIELNPNYPTVHHWYSICLREQGKLEQARAEIGIAQKLDPLSAIISINVGEELSLMGRTDEAIAQFKKTIDLDPNFPGTYSDLGVEYFRHGKTVESYAAFDKLRQVLGPDNLYAISAVGYVYGKTGRKKEALDILDRLLAASEHGSIQGGQIAIVYLGLGEKSKCLDWLERAYLEKNIFIGYLKISPLLDEIRSEPRFIALLKKIGLDKSPSS